MDNKHEAFMELELYLAGALKAYGKLYPQYDVMDEHNRNTPHRIAKAWMELGKGYGEIDFEFTTFDNEFTLSESDWVILKDIEFSSLCQHHFFPFSGKVHIGYVPDKKICGISKLARVVEYFSTRPQVQEGLGADILTFLSSKLKPLKLAIIIESSHTCVACRGVKAKGSKMVTYHALDKTNIKEFKEMMK